MGAVESHWITGIKITKDGVKRYKCRMYCKGEGYCKPHNVYVSKKQKVAKCLVCGTSHKIVKAWRDEDRDKHGNYFVAEELI